MSEHIHWRKTFDPNFIGEWDFEPGKDKILTIKSTRREECTFEGGRKEVKNVVHWVENEKPMILNATNCRTIVKLTGKKYFDEWDGLRIQLYVDPSVKGKSGETVGGVRIRAKLPEVAKISCEACGKMITPAFSMSASQLAAYTKQKYGKNLCAECAKEQKEAATDATE